MPQPRKKATSPPRRRYRPLPAPVTGKAPPNIEGDHMAGFNAAIADALRRVDWPRGRDFATEVELRAVVSRYNPGVISEYRVTLQGTGDAT